MKKRRRKASKPAPSKIRPELLDPTWIPGPMKNKLAIRINLFVILLGFILAEYFQSQKVPPCRKPRPLLNLARAYQFRRELDQAVPLYKELLASSCAAQLVPETIEPGDYAGTVTYHDYAGVNLSAIYTDGGLYEESNKLLDSLNQTPYVTTNKAVIFLRQRRPAEALELLQANRDLCSLHASCLYNWGQAFDAFLLCDQAQDKYRKARQLDPDIPQPPCPDKGVNVR